jgi:hypothetical protein
VALAGQTFVFIFALYERKNEYKAAVHPELVEGQANAPSEKLAYPEGDQKKP